MRINCVSWVQAGFSDKRDSASVGAFRQANISRVEMPNFYNIIPSPVGHLTLIASDKGVMAVLWANEDPKRVGIDKGEQRDDFPLLLTTAQQLREYFDGSRKIFELPLHFHGTDFQQQVWQALLTIPYGETRSYLQIAQQIGNENLCALWARQMAKILSRSSHPVTG